MIVREREKEKKVKRGRGREGGREKEMQGRSWCGLSYASGVRPFVRVANVNVGTVRYKVPTVAQVCRSEVRDASVYILRIRGIAFETTAGPWALTHSYLERD